MWAKGERANLAKKDDTLKLEGSFERRNKDTWISGKRAELARRDDTLKLEGNFEKRIEVRFRLSFYPRIGLSTQGDL